jgi:predicted GNAT family acetyltransferase
VGLIRPLRPGHEPALESFLKQHADTSMFLRSNSRAAGLVYEGRPLQAEYVAGFEGERIVAVVAHCWNDMLLVQAPVQVEAVARAAVAHSGRPVAGLSGPADQVAAARHALGLDDRPSTKFGREERFALDLADLVVPEPLTDGRWSTRHPRAGELEHFTDWRVDFAREALKRRDAPGLREECHREVTLLHELNSDWVLEDEGTVVAYSAFNAALPDIVQVGGVWVPPGLRGQGYGRGVVAGSLLDARRRGVSRAVLFAEREDAKRAYLGIGFERKGDFGLVLF